MKDTGEGQDWREKQDKFNVQSSNLRVSKACHGSEQDGDS